MFNEIKVILRRNLSMVQTTFHFCENVRKLEKLILNKTNIEILQKNVI